VLQYAVLIIGGGIGGFLLPAQWKKTPGAALMAIFYVGVVFAFGVSKGFHLNAMLSFFVLQERVPASEPGLSALVMGGSIWVLSVLVLIARLLLRRRGPAINNDTTTDRAA